MAGLYQKFLRKKLDLSPLDLNHGTDTTYFCTPQGAKVIGWAGVDGIHFCFIRGFGEMVFAVSPMNGPGEYVHPVARDFSDFLRLLLACGGTAAIEQAWQWSESEFQEFLWQQLPSTDQQRALDLVAETFELFPMEQPYLYLHKLQSEFDLNRIRFTKEYYGLDLDEPDTCTAAHEWKVYWNSDFGEHRGNDKSGKELDVGKELEWNGDYWYIPALYLCGKGLVIDICHRIPAQKVADFEKFVESVPHFDSETCCNPLDQMRIDAHDPFCQTIEPAATANGKALEWCSSSGIQWHPNTAGDPFETTIMSRYKLDRTQYWQIWRCSFSWATKRRPTSLNRLTLTLQESPKELPGEPLCPTQAGQQFTLTDPNTGSQHTLTVCELENRTTSFSDDEYEYPKNYTLLTYTLKPESERSTFVLRDCCEGDRPRKNTFAPNPAEADSSSAAFVIGIIGGADGPTVITCGIPDEPDSSLHGTCSSLYFETPEQINWFPIFKATDCNETVISLL